MNTKRKILVIGRHGDTPKGVQFTDPSYDSITPESVGRLYANAGRVFGPFVDESKIGLGNTFVRHSNKQRTKYTAQAMLAGAFALQPVPQSYEELDGLGFGNARISLDDRLSYEHMKFHDEASQRETAEHYIANWIANPDMTEYKGAAITPYRDALRAAKSTLRDSVLGLTEEEKYIGFLTSHASIAEAVVFSALQPVETKDSFNFGEIGGPFEREGFGTLVLDYNEGSGLYQARFERNGQNYDVDLQELMN